MAQEFTEIAKIESRINELEDWLSANAPDCGREQKHLVVGSPERAYWHYGYTVAIRDVMKLLTGETVAKA